ncbi:MAG: hypothetical protein Q9195_005455 [Heterodermia aff. obscurata]
MANVIEAEDRPVRNGSLVSALSRESKIDVSAASMESDSTEGDAFIAEEPTNKILGPGAQQKHDESRSKSPAQNNNSSKKLKRHVMSLWLASAFAIASIFIWEKTCTLSYKPVRFGTYYDTTGRFSRGQYEQNDRWRRVSRVGLQVIGTLSIPLTIVGKTLSMPNRNWELSLPSVIEATIAGKAGDLQPNLWVSGQNSSSLTSMDSFYSSSIFPSDWNSSDWNSAQKEGYNLPLQGPQTEFQAKPFFTSSLTVGTDTGILKALALRISTSLQCKEIVRAEFPSDCNKTASLARNFTNTQYRRAADWALGGNYVAPIFSFRICSPKAESWTLDNDSSQSIREEVYMDLQTWRSSPTEDKMDILDDPIRYNFTYHCIADSDLAYFEPMNEWNGRQVQDMVNISATDVPHFTGPNTRLNTHKLIYSPNAPGPLATSVHALFGNNTFFNSIINANDTSGANLEVCRALRMPLTGLCTPRGSHGLMCNPYQFQSGSTLSCIDLGEVGESGTLPPEDYGLLNATAADGTLAYYLYMWLQRFNNWNSTMAALTLTNFYSARAILDPSRATELDVYSNVDDFPSLNSTEVYSTVDYDDLPESTTNKVFDTSATPLALPVYSSPGLRTQKLHIPFHAIVTISLLILAQTTGLLALAVYTSMRPTWTASLDGFALLRMGKAMSGDALPLISAADAREANVLDDTEGWIGDENDEKNEVGERHLQVGGSGRVVLNARYRTKREPETLE